MRTTLIILVLLAVGCNRPLWRTENDRPPHSVQRVRGYDGDKRIWWDRYYCPHYNRFFDVMVEGERDD